LKLSETFYILVQLENFSEEKNSLIVISKYPNQIIKKNAKLKGTDLSNQRRRNRALT